MGEGELSSVRAQPIPADRLLSRAISTLRCGSRTPAPTPTSEAVIMQRSGPLRTKLLPRRWGASRPDHIAPTFDDGPDPLSTPFFLRLPDAHSARATFFVLGSMSRRS
ncbi:polysaccharide deacetylase family protein [Streptomyces sp. NPDC059153]|uniref:polysaccharide deacetylase family protein n=1 Tax=Streptomyces sp. NPDC059153 TaxID=3346743 RepID=UPI0036BC60BB